MKRVWIVVGIIMLVVVASGAGYFAWKSRTNTTASVAQLPSPTPIPEEMGQWTDQAGFSFTYPKNIKINPHDEDNENYAHIEFTNPDNPGRIIVWAKDTTAQNAAGWVKGEKTLKDGVVFETTIAGQPGQKVLVSTPKKKIITAMIDDAVVFYVEGEFDNSEYWTRVYDTITSTFALTAAADEAPQPGQADGVDETAVDEEEVLE